MIKKANHVRDKVKSIPAAGSSLSGLIQNLEEQFCLTADVLHCTVYLSNSDCFRKS